MYQTGLVSISFRKLTPKQVIDAVAAAGLKYIEWGSDVHAPCNDIARLEEIARMQKESGISCSSYGTYYHIGKEKTEEIYDYIKAAKILGTNILRLWCGSGKPCAEFTQEEREAIYAQGRELAKIAEQENVILCMERHGWTLTEEAESALQVMQAVDSPAFRMYWQPNQYKTVEDNIASAKLLAPYVYNIHVFNWEGDVWYPLRGGLETWRKYLSCIPGDHILLLEFMPDNRVESLPEEASALFEMIGEK